MHVTELLHKTFKKELSFIHKRTLQNLMDASTTLIKSKVLSLTALGRNFPKKIQACSRIKTMDRLLGNKDLHKDSVRFYQVMNRFLLQEGSRPWIHVDWSCINSVTKMYLLRASLSMKGRAIVIYEECHPKSKENNHATHQLFLINLKKILIASVKPILVTDAGFRAPWFASVRALGWDFVGRVKNKNSIKLSHHTAWISSKELYNRASNKPTCLGEGLLTKKEELPVHFVLFKGTSKKKRIYKSRSRRSGHRAR